NLADRTRSDDVPDRIDERDDPYPEARGVLLAEMIERYIDDLHPSLIQEATKETQIGPASYDLRLGEKYYQDGKFKTLTEDYPYVTIKPHSMVVVSTYEILHLPRYIIGRWNMRVGL